MRLKNLLPRWCILVGYFQKTLVASAFGRNCQFFITWAILQDCGVIFGYSSPLG